MPNKAEVEKVNSSFSENSLKMLKKRYLRMHKNGTQETPYDMFRRVAKTLANVERKYKHGAPFVAKTEWDFFSIMSSKEYTPAGRTMTNAGAGTALVANCIVLPIHDSMESIFQTLKDAALLQQAGSGLGFSLDELRPAMTPTKRSNGVSSGPVSFLKVYNEAFGTIKQQGRHGANMAMMSVDHPDILDFIRAKEIEGEISNFNISIKVTDAFMKTLVETPDAQWYCKWKGEKTKPHKVIRAKNGSAVGIEEIDITVKQLFDELVNYAWTNGEPGIVFIDEINRTNPLPELGKIEASNPCITGDTIIDTIHGRMQIKDLVGESFLVYTMENGRLSLKRAYDVRKTRESARIIKIVTKRGELKVTPEHRIFVKNKGWIEAQNLKKRDVLVGLQRIKKSEKYLRVKLTSEVEYIPEHRFVLGHYYDLNDKDVHHKDGNTFNNAISNLKAIPHSEHSIKSNVGHIDWNERNSLGMFISKEEKKKKDNREYSNELKGGVTVLKIEEAGYADVYNMEVEETNNYIANGIVVHNCGEQFLHPYDNCNLGSINLSVFVKNGGVYWERLTYVTRIATRLMDNVIDLFDFPVPAITEMALRNRRIGLGIMGFADMLFQLGVAYNSEEGRQMAGKVMNTINSAAHNMSMELANEKGVFPNWDKSVFKRRDIEMRNAALTTVAPTGSISMMFDTSSGMEPNFALMFVKQDKDGVQYHYFNPIFEKALINCGLKKTEMKEVRDELLKTGSIQDLKILPEELRKTFVVAMDISAEDHMKMQAAFQKFVDNSISKTINFSKRATREEVFEGFVSAWQNKCKSCTVYRDGSRQVQILNLGTGEGLIAPSEIGKGPKPKNMCPDCGSPMTIAEGCSSCPNCGLSLCG